MSISLDNLKQNKGAAKKRKIIGRGNASGHGTTAAKGTKGQKARAGVSGLKRLGMRQVLLRTPKLRGFKSLTPKPLVVNLSAIEKFYKEGETVDKASLKKFKLIDKIKSEVKILGDGELVAAKNLTFVGLKISHQAKVKIEKVEGKIA